MIVIGADTHKRSYSFAAIRTGTGQLLGDETDPATAAGHEQLLARARAIDAERVWAVEDCRHVSAKLERFLLARGERVVRVPPHLMAGRRKGLRQAGKSDPIDALAVARAALEEGVETLPTAALDGPSREIKLLLDHREDLVGKRTRVQNRLRWLLHDRWPELDLPNGCLDHRSRLEPLSRRLARCEQAADVRVMRSQIQRLTELNREAKALEKELAELVAVQQPKLLNVPGIGTLTAAKLIAEIAGIDRFKTPAQLARLAGIAPIPAQSGNSRRVRLHRGGNRQINAAVYRIAITQMRMHPPAIDFINRKIAEGKTKKEAIRCLKRHLIRVIYREMQPLIDPYTHLLLT